MDQIDAEGRRIYDPSNKSFDHVNRRVTDLTENKKVNLPHPCDPHTESNIEMIIT